MELSFFLKIIENEIKTKYNFHENKNYTFKNFFWESKNKNENDIFIAIRGNNNNGNEFIENAIKNGYKYVISDDEKYVNENSILIKNNPNIPFILIKDIQKFFDVIGEWGIRNFKGKKIAITGSSGKTSTTYMVSNILKIFYPNQIAYTDKYNSQYYLRRFWFFLQESNCKFAISELSSDSLGTIEKYAKILNPHYSIITSIGSAHIEKFKSKNNIFIEKTSLILHTKEKAFILDTYKDQIKNNIKLTTYINIINFIKENDFLIERSVNSENIRITKVTLNYNRENSIIIENPKIKGKHNYNNMLLVLKLLQELNLLNNDSDKHKVSYCLQTLNCFPGRGNVIHFIKKDIKIKIICEHHNSNPESFTNTINSITSNTFLVMGYMYELGDKTQDIIYEILQNIEQNIFITQVIIGDKKLLELPFLSDENEYDEGGHHRIFKKIIKIHENFLDYIPMMRKYNTNNILFKGSRSSRLEEYIFTIINS